MSKCYLLGAGASVGYTESKPMPLRPPRSADFFLRGRDFGLLNEEILPELCAELREYIGSDDPLEELPPDDLREDIEEFLKYLIERPADDPESETNPNKAIGQCIYFLYELLRHYQILYYPNNNYRRLALHHFDNNYDVVSLNYDTLFETAVTDVGLNVNYIPRENRFRFMNVAKPHGSINWLNTLHGIQAGHEGTIAGVAHLIYQMHITGGDATEFQRVSNSFLQKIEHTEFVRTAKNFSFPLLIPPVALHKIMNNSICTNRLKNS